ncbi:MAG: hypothetical protein QT11_C0001G0244 [archaeon GW2011_AR20]|nr:MAG: hypothetical protein QT11_C0001G0244 [archaeon GW2011_AR20]
MRKIALKKPPTDKVKIMKDDNVNDEEILKALKPDYSNQEIDDAFNQSSQDGNILDELDQFEPSKEQQDAPEDLLEEAPSPEGEEPSLRYTQSNTGYNQPAPELGSSQIQEIVESIVEEKWDDLISKIGDVNLWKESVNNDLEAVKQEILRVQEKFNNLQNILVGRVHDYNKNVSELNSEMKALEQVMQKIIEPLTTNVKELGKITSELKKKKSRSI